ncbi:MAG: 2-oxoacid:acceptor oxidoreductase family protein [Candidatus Omnitrophica bacterium]|nr:2-oxoacid:acceptor oxidoreductase family protein [Candidatus Omnitrophota bacterium]
MREEIIFAGFGGQGIMFMGKAIAYAAMNEGKFVTWIPSYGAEVRGGTAYSMVVISDEAIASPLIKDPTICVAMNSPSLRKYEAKIKTNGLLVVNKSIIDIEPERKDIEILNIPVTELASEAGDYRIGNMVALGALLRKRKIISLESLINGLKDIVSSTYHSLLPVNEKAIRKGFEYGSR